METAANKDLLAFLKQNTTLSGVGTKTWEELIPQNMTLTSVNADWALYRISEEVEGLTVDPDLAALLKVLENRVPGIGPEFPGQEPGEAWPIADWPIPDWPVLDWPIPDPLVPDPEIPDPGTSNPWERPLLPGTVAPGPGTIVVDGVRLVLNPAANTNLRGPQAYTRKLARVRTKLWKCCTGTVEVVLKEGTSKNGPWNIEHDRFTLTTGEFAPNRAFTPSGGRSQSWWLLRVTALGGPSEFFAPPFRSF